mmetsp:Transcript_19739/g.27117  ORF Transcript_19739/g.27117 Transcript_19739/m.27117 type:complete len:2769 (-) Transcript_19739:85-8391(-)
MFSLTKKVLTIKINNQAKGDPSILRFGEYPLKSGAWYHFCMLHTKPKLFFGKDEFTVYLDNQLIFQDFVKFPIYSDGSSNSGYNDIELTFGENLDGQMGPIYVFNESLGAQVVESIARLDAKRPVDGIDNSLNTVIVDLLPSITTTADKKVHPIMSKLIAAYHPLRWSKSLALDIHGGHHASFGTKSRACNITAVRDTLTSVGGIYCLLPLFPQILAEPVDYDKLLRGGVNMNHICSSDMRFQAINNGSRSMDFSNQNEVELSRTSKKRRLKKSKSKQVGYVMSSVGNPLSMDLDWHLDDSVLDYSALSKIKDDKANFDGDQCIGLLLSVLAKCIIGHKVYKQDLLRYNAIEMIEAALLFASSDILQMEGENCVLSLIQLKSAASDVLGLEIRITKLLLCNFMIWSEASFYFLNSLMSVILTAMRSQPLVYLQLLGVDFLLESLNHFMPQIITSVEGSINIDTEASVALALDEREPEVCDSASVPLMYGIEKRDIYDVDEERGTHSRSMSEDIHEYEKVACDVTRVDADLTIPQLSNEQRCHLRRCLQTMILILIQHGESEKEVIPVIDFMATCRDNIVLNEVANMLLLLVVEGDQKLISQIVSGFHGVEEYAAFVLFHLVHQPHEELRCTGIRLLTHLYLKVHSINSSILSLSLKRGKRIASRIGLLSVAYQGLQRLQSCGGLASLCEIISSHASTSTETTYRALLEFLLLKPGSRSQITVLNSDLLDSFMMSASIIASATATATAAAVSRSQSSNFDIITNMNRQSNNRFVQKSVGYSSHITGQNFIDEVDNDMTNSVVLPIFLELLPKLPVTVHGQIYSDLLGLLKHSLANRIAFCSCPSWHICMYELISLLIDADKRQTHSRVLNSHDILFEIEKYNTKGIVVNDGFCTGIRREMPPSPYNTHHSDSKRQSDEVDTSNFDIWFALGMKIYATVLLHAQENEHGWKEIDRCVAHSYNSENGFALSQAVLSHTLSELSFSMHSRYKEIQRLNKSSVSSDNKEATAKLVNILSIILAASQLALLDKHCVTPGIQDYHINKLRIQYFDEIFASYEANRTSMDNLKTSTKSPAVTAEELRHQQELRALHDRRNAIYLAELAIKNITSGEGWNECNSFINSSHVWFDVAILSVASPKEQSNRAFSKVSGFYNPLFEELLTPLERCHDIEEGSLILVLQTLRVFDVLFWPDIDGPILNVAIMRFRKESFYKQNSTESPNQKLRLRSMSVFSASLRMCLFVLNHLSPISYAAIVNLKRIRAMMQATAQMQKFNIPITDWVSVTALNITLQLLRIRQFLEPIFKAVGFNELFDINIPTVGPWTDSNDSNDEINTIVFGRFEQLAQKPELLNDLYGYFDCSPGRNLIRHIRQSLFVLAELYFTHHATLETAFEERSFHALGRLAEIIRNRNIIDTLRRECNETAGAPSANHDVDSNGTELIDIDNVSTDGGGEGTVNNDSHSDSVAQDPEQQPSEATSNGQRMFAPAKVMSKSMKYAMGLLEAADFLEKPLDNIETLLTQNQSSDESFVAVDILHNMACLVSSYFRLNPFRNVDAIRSIASLDRFEAEAVHTFKCESRFHKQVLEELRDQALKNIEEVAEMKDLSRQVRELIRNRIKSRLAPVKVFNTMKNRNVSALWADCLQSFRSDLSPYSDNRLEIKPGCAYYELSQHKDCSMRNIVLMALNRPIDHTGAAYLDGKIRDQMDFISRSSGDGTSTDTNGVKPSVSVSDLNIQFSVNKKSSEPGQHEWDNDEEDDNDSDVNDVSSLKSRSDSHPEEQQQMLLSRGITDTAKGIATIFSVFTGTEKRPQWSLMYRWQSDERVVFVADATQITLFSTISGTVLVTNKCIYFHGKQTYPSMDVRWSLDQLIEVYGRRYLLQNCAIELFFADMSNVFLAFGNKVNLLKFFKHLRRQPTPQVKTSWSLNPKYLFASSGWTELWRKRLITNFEYLMHLNILGGRSYNDITQYHVFPWVIANYTSPHLDLKNPDSFRDLSKSVGALNPTRLNDIRERFKSFDDESVPKFMFGSHYSSAGVVMHYLIRQEPYCSLAINLQGGRFDCPDRIFFDINRTWVGCHESMSDVKELVPELFSCPEILINTNQLSFGELQEGGLVDNVILPPWAKDAFEFVRINKEALESDYVSEHLHEWIDLIFGCKQQGAAAIAADNLFHYLTYENAVNLETIEDPLQREAAKSQVIHFGQTPSQLLLKEHPKRFPKEECILPLCADIQSISRIRLYSPGKLIAINQNRSSVISIRCVSDRLLVVHSDLNISYYRWSAFPDVDGTPFTIKFDRLKQLGSSNLSACDETIRSRQLCGSNSPSNTVPQPLTDPGSPPKADATRILRSNSLFSFIKSVGAANKSNASTEGGSLVEYDPAGILKDDKSAVYIPLGAYSNSRRVARDDLNLPSSFNLVDHTGIGNISDSGSTASSVVRVMRNNHALIAVTDSAQSRLVSCGYWDHSLKVHAIDTLKELTSVNIAHHGQISCVQSNSSCKVLCNSPYRHCIITGGMDGTCRMWAPSESFTSMQIQNHRSVMSMLSVSSNQEGSLGDNSLVEDAVVSSLPSDATAFMHCLHVLYGHETAVISLSYSSDMDLILSGSVGGLICLHSARKGKFIRSIHHMQGASVDVMTLTSAGYVVAHSWETLELHLFWINGQALMMMNLTYRIECMACNTNTANVIVCGCSYGVVSFRTVWNMEEIHVIAPNDSYLDKHFNREDINGDNKDETRVLSKGAVTCLCFSDDNQQLFVGYEDGSFGVAADSDEKWKTVVQKSPIV